MSTEIQKYNPDDQRLALLEQYNPADHIKKWTALNKKTNITEIVEYYPAGWRLHELRLRYPTAKFDIDIVLLDQQNNFCIVRARLYIGSDYESAEIRAVAHKQGMLSALDKVETQAKARAARDWGIGTEYALEIDDTPENEVMGTIVSEERTRKQKQQRQTVIINDSNDGRIISTQIETLTKIYGKLGQQPPEDLKDWTYEQASNKLKELPAQLKQLPAPAPTAPGPKAEPEPANVPATDQQKASIEKLCDRLQKSVPAVANFNQAREVIRQLTEELKAQKASEKAEPAKPEPAPETEKPQESTVRILEERQFDTLVNLYGKLGIEVPDIGKWSYEQAAIGIKELSKKLNEKLKAKAS